MSLSEAVSLCDIFQLYYVYVVCKWMSYFCILIFVLPETLHGMICKCSHAKLMSQNSYIFISTTLEWSIYITLYNYKQLANK